jgi:hypothetical protein
LASSAVPADETIMKSEFVEVVEIAPPPLRPPDVTGAGALESRDRYLPYVRGDYFARATAVYHLDRCVRTLESIGVDVADFFAPADETGTNPPARPGLPIEVDPCVESIAGINMATNAMTLGNASGVEGICIGELAVDAGVTAATDPRLVWHEFGHVLLFTRDPRSNGRLPFAHGIGDALAAIHFDPDSAVRGDSSLRGLCFPWFRDYRPHRIARRHDWRFDEPQGMIWSRLDPDSRSEYQREEVLSSTLFRLYRAVGGDSISPTRRRLASNYVLFLIVQAIGAAKLETLQGPHEFRDLLIAADAGIDRGAFEDIPRGALEKVIAWAFEEQGLDAFQDESGRWRRSPPALDVFIDSAQPDDNDGFWAGYPGSEYFWESTAIRNRLKPDGGVDHESPRPGGDNFLYVRIRNRGRLSVPSPSIQFYYQRAMLAPVWQAGSRRLPQRRRWRSATLAREMPPMPADSTVFQDAVFVWRPDTPGPWSFLAAVSARQGDAADCCSLEASDVEDRPAIGARDRALWALAPHDNNLGVRSIASAAGGAGARAFVNSIDPDLWLSNPYPHRACAVRVRVELPVFLSRLGWCASVEPPSEPITLPAGGDCRLKLRVTPGNDFGAADVPLGASDRRLRIFCVDVSHDPTDMEGIILGGITYEIDRDIYSADA